MSTFKKLIDSKAAWLLVLSILALVAWRAAASHTDHVLRLASGGIIVTSNPSSAEVPLPKTPPDSPAPAEEPA
jgi:hypothetical protein